MTNRKELFQAYQKNAIALYGLGVETEKVINELDDFNIVGLLDGFQETGCMYGKNIFSIQDCCKMNVKLIIVVARPGSCRAIKKRIGKFCEDNQIALFDIRGKNLTNHESVVFDLEVVNGVKKEEVLASALSADVISFDLFDTLVMRRVLLPTDVIELVDSQLKEQGIDIDYFTDKRLQAEKELSKSKAPILSEIYSYVLKICDNTNITADEMATLEWSLDYSLIVPRKEVIDLLMELSHHGKKIYVVTDSYYTLPQIEKILEKCQIKDKVEIMVSCEFRMSKTQGLFHLLKEKEGITSYLHIGDDSISDIESAEKEGIQTIQLMSAIDLLEVTGYFGMWDDLNDLSNRIKLGMLITKLFNSPFQFETNDRKLIMNTPYELGYYFAAPMITDFVIWFHQIIKREEIHNIWFCARDGYLIKKLYDLLPGRIESNYFLTSRTAAIRAGMETIDDIKYVSSMKYSGTLSNQMFKRFGITVPDTDETKSELKDYADLIFQKSMSCKINNLKYVKSLKLDNEKIAFFDFVAKGTTQMYCQRLLDNHMKGIYFLQLEKENMKDKNLDIVSFYGDEDCDTNAIYEDYYILETILTSPMPSVQEFDGNGDPCYAVETRTADHIDCFMEIQEGILDYFKTYISICPANKRDISKILDEKLLTLIHKMQIQNKAFLNFNVEDPFFNRYTKVTDLL